MNVGHWEPFSGASGDMLLGAALDAGADLDAVQSLLGGLGVDGWELDVERVERGGIAALRAVVKISPDSVVRTWGHVRQLLTSARLPEAVRLRALGTFQRMAEAEAHLQRRDVDRVHFHERGALDSLIDVVGACIALHLLGVEEVTSAPVAQGVGMIRTDYGLKPVPAPVVLELLRGAPTYSTGVSAELCTPTGAALLAEWVDRWQHMPPVQVTAIGYGAGQRQLDRPNLVRLVIGQRVDQVLPGAATASPEGDEGLRPAG